MTGRVATAETDIRAPRSKVWQALTDPDQIQKYMFGSRVETDWKPGSTIVWKGEYEGKKYEDKGEILEVENERRLKMTHFSPLSGEPDADAVDVFEEGSLSRSHAATRRKPVTAIAAHPARHG